MGPSPDYSDQVLNQLAKDAKAASLHTADPGDDGSRELFWESYARQEVTWVPAVGGDDLRNANVLDFDNLPRTRITHMGLWDAVTGGRFLWGVDLPAQEPEDDEEPDDLPGLALKHGNTLQVRAGRLECFIDPATRRSGR